MSIDARLRSCLADLKHHYEGTAQRGGSDKISEIRSGSIIRHLEEWAAAELIAAGIDRSAISTTFKANGFFKTKDQDVSVLCQKFGCSRHQKIPPLTINVRSQLSSIQKNFDTLFERLVAETLNLHLADPEHVAGFLYLVPLWGYDEKALKEGNIELTESYQRGKYVQSFELIDGRTSANDKEWKYERVCLLTVDFSSDPPNPVVGLPSERLDPELYSGLDTTRVWHCLQYRNLFSDLVRTARERFGAECLRLSYNS